MTIELITDHEAAMRAACRRPLGTDQQGRFPEVAPVADDEDDGFGAIEGLLNIYGGISAATIILAIIAVVLL
jgi:hypothetical protein